MAEILTQDLSTFYYIQFNVAGVGFKVPCVDFTYESDFTTNDRIIIPASAQTTPENGFVFEDVPVGLGSTSVITEQINYSALENGYGLLFRNRPNYPKQSTVVVMSDNFEIATGSGTDPVDGLYSNGGVIAVKNTINNKFILYALSAEIPRANNNIIQTLPYPKGSFNRKYNFSIYLSRYHISFYNWSDGHYSEVDTDPYVDGGGSSGGGGGTGDFDGTSDTIGLPSLPSLSGLNTGFFTAFVPSASQMQSVSNYLWNNAITDILDPDTGLGEKVDALKKIVANPYDAIMGCSIIPVTPPTAGSKELKMYGLLETGISLPYASTRWVQVDCGALNIHEFWGSYLDYSPYTKTTSLYLPYIGTVSIDIDLIMSKSIQVVYYVDILSGICVAFILVDGSVKFHYQGQCSTQVPITNADYSSTISAGIGLIGNASQVVGSAVTGAGAGGIGGAVAGAVSGAISQAPAVASNVMSAKPDIRSGGAIGSSAGILSVQRPYLIIERPKQSVPAFQNHFTGYPSNVTAKVSDLTGYTEFETINLDGIALTDAEKAELDNILKGGVYL